MWKYKQVIVVRHDLKLSKGKVSAQVAHASLEAYKLADPGIRKEWEHTGAKKVVLKAEGLKEILELSDKLKKLGISCSIIRDMGKTEVEPGTVTAMGAGPADEKELDKVNDKHKV